MSKHTNDTSSILDARGRSCPEPVLMVKQALAQGAPVKILVDNQVAVENITRFAQGKGLGIKVQNQGADFQLTIG